MLPVLETTRLQLRPLRPDDLLTLHQIFVQPGVRKYLCDDQIFPPTQIESFIQQSGETFARNGYGLWALVPRDEETIIGACGYWLFREPPELELLYLLAEEFWGQGLAVEAARAVLDYGFTALGFERIQASTDAPNRASIRVMEKLGMSFWKRETVDGLDTIFYTVSRTDFAASTFSSRVI